MSVLVSVNMAGAMKQTCQLLFVFDDNADRWRNISGMTKYRKGPQRTHQKPTKDRKGALRAKLQEIGTN